MNSLFADHCLTVQFIRDWNPSVSDEILGRPSNPWPEESLACVLVEHLFAMFGIILMLALDPLMIDRWLIEVALHTYITLRLSLCIPYGIIVLCLLLYIPQVSLLSPACVRFEGAVVV